MYRIYRIFKEQLKLNLWHNIPTKSILTLNGITLWLVKAFIEVARCFALSVLRLLLLSVLFLLDYNPHETNDGYQCCEEEKDSI